MENDIDPATIYHMDRSTVKVRFINDKNKLNRFTTGFFIEKIGRLAIVFTIAHFVEPMPDIEYKETDQLEIVCYGSNEAYPCCVELLIPESVILSCYTKIEIEHFYKFAPKEEWERDLKGQKIMSTSHPFFRQLRVTEVIVASDNYLNGKSIRHYDPNLMFFDHNMAMGKGSSGAAILNMNKNILGMQSGTTSLKHRFVSAVPWDKAYSSKKTGNKSRDENLAINGVDLSIKACDIGLVKTHPANANYVVHVAYLDVVFRDHLSHFIEKGGTWK